jgi:hypothetical protein
MSPDDRQYPAEQIGPDELKTLVLELSLDSAEPIGGFVGRAGEQERVAFRGWVDLMSAINSVRTIARTRDGACPPG